VRKTLKDIYVSTELIFFIKYWFCGSRRQFLEDCPHFFPQEVTVLKKVVLVGAVLVFILSACLPKTANVAPATAAVSTPTALPSPTSTQTIESAPTPEPQCNPELVVWWAGQSRSIQDWENHLAKNGLDLGRYSFSVEWTNTPEKVRLVVWDTQSSVAPAVDLSFFAKLDETASQFGGKVLASTVEGKTYAHLICNGVDYSTLRVPYGETCSPPSDEAIAWWAFNSEGNDKSVQEWADFLSSFGFDQSKWYFATDWTYPIPAVVITPFGTGVDALIPPFVVPLGATAGSYGADLRYVAIVEGEEDSLKGYKIVLCSK
jgi:hypothetical protein